MTTDWSQLAVWALVLFALFTAAVAVGRLTATLFLRVTSSRHR